MHAHLQELSKINTAIYLGKALLLIQYNINIFLQIQYRPWTSSLPETADTAADDGLAGEDERISRANGCVNTTMIEKEPASTK
jgi:hypothetical protein